MLDFINQYFQFIIAISTLIGILFPIFRWVLDMNANVKKILHELSPNHGASLKDKVTKMEQSFDEYKNLVKYVYTTQNWILSMFEKMLFKCDESGNWIWVNEKLSDTLNITENYLLNNGWRNFIVEKDRESVMNMWDECVQNKKDICIITNFTVTGDDLNPASNILKVTIIAERLDDKTYVGWIKPFKKKDLKH